MAHRTLVGLSILSRPPSLVCSYERLAAEACARGSPPPRPPPSKLRYECAILPMVAGGNLLTVMAPAAQHTRSFLFAHNCDEETALFGERVGGWLRRLCTGHAGKVKRSETTPIMEAVANVNGANERPAVQTASGRAIQT